MLNEHNIYYKELEYLPTFKCINKLIEAFTCVPRHVNRKDVNFTIECDNSVQVTCGNKQTKHMKFHLSQWVTDHNFML